MNIIKLGPYDLHTRAAAQMQSHSIHEPPGTCQDTIEARIRLDKDGKKPMKWRLMSTDNSAPDGYLGVFVVTDLLGIKMGCRREYDETKEDHQEDFDTEGWNYVDLLEHACDEFLFRDSHALPMASS